MVNYNNGKYIQQAIESVIRQTFIDWELLIFDDGSIDNSFLQISKYLKDKRILLYKNNINRGKVPCLLNLVSKSRADIFGILDSDDVLTEDALSLMYDAHISHYNCGFVYSQFEFCDSKMNSISTGYCRPVPNGDTNMRKIYSSAFRTFKRYYYDKTDGYDEEFVYGQDRDIVLKMEEVTEFFFVDNILYRHRVLYNSISNNPQNKLLSRLLLIRANYNAYFRRQDYNLPNLSKTEMGVQLFQAAVISMILKESKEGIEYLRLAFNIKSTILMNIGYYLAVKIYERFNRYFFSNESSLSIIYERVNREVDSQIRNDNNLKKL